MRIIAGKYARRAIESPAWAGVRPLLSRLRRSLFDTLNPYLLDGTFLDLYGGTGAFTIEALSRGAASATVVELDPRTADLIKRNVKEIGVKEPVDIVRGNALEKIPLLAKQGKEFTVIAMAPPYHLDLENQTLDQLDLVPELLAPDGIAFVQYPRGEDVKLERENLEIWRTRHYGNTSFTYYVRREE